MPSPMTIADGVRRDIIVAFNYDQSNVEYRKTEHEINGCRTLVIIVWEKPKVQAS